MLNKGVVKKGAAKQSRIKSIAWHLRWLVRSKNKGWYQSVAKWIDKTRTDIKLWPSKSVRSKTDIKVRPSSFIKTRTDIKLQTIGLVRSY